MDISELKNYNILYAEDSATIRMQLFDAFTELFNNVYVASDGEEALKIYHENKNNINLLVTDIQMPNKNGIELIKAIREEDNNMPIIITTAHDESGYLLDSINIGVSKFIIKPMKYEKVVESVTSAMEPYHQNLELIQKNKEVNALLAMFKTIVNDKNFNFEQFRKQFSNHDSNIKYEDIELFS
jgi:two-component system, cell cycle response regulator